MASWQAKQRNPLFDQSTQAALERRGKEVVGAALVVLGALIALVMLAMLVVGFGAWDSAATADAARAVPIVENTLNTNAIGAVLYDRYLLAFQLAGLILLVAMIGAILLTLRHRRDVKRQDVLQQMWRDPAKAMRMTNPKPGQGLQ